jgi:hypothetical protein
MCSIFVGLVGMNCVFYVCGRDHTVLCGIGHRQEMGASDVASKQFTRQYFRIPAVFPSEHLLVSTLFFSDDWPAGRMRAETAYGYY